MRNSLLHSGAVKKYIFYAVGEILLVMIGILLALQVNNWNEYQKDRVTEKKMLQDLAETIQLNIQQLDDQIASNQRCDLASNAVIKALDHKSVYHDSLSAHFGWAMAIENRGRLSTIGYDALKSAGVDIVLNDELKKEIVFLFEETYQNSITRIERMNQLYIENIKLRQQHFLRGDSFSFVPFDWQKLRSDSHFYSWLITIRNTRDWGTQSIRKSRAEAERVLELIQNDLRLKK